MPAEYCQGDPGVQVVKGEVRGVNIRPVLEHSLLGVSSFLVFIFYD